MNGIFSWQSLPIDLLTAVCAQADEPSRDALLCVNKGMLPCVLEARQAQVKRDQAARTAIEPACLPMRLELHERGCNRPHFRNILATCAPGLSGGSKQREYEVCAAEQAAGTWDPTYASGACLDDTETASYFLESSDLGIKLRVEGRERDNIAVAMAQRSDNGARLMAIADPGKNIVQGTHLSAFTASGQLFYEGHASERSVAGRGVLHFPPASRFAGYRYEGTFADDQMHGTGSMIKGDSVTSCAFAQGRGLTQPFDTSEPLFKHGIFHWYSQEYLYSDHVWRTWGH